MCGELKKIQGAGLPHGKQGQTVQRVVPLWWTLGSVSWRWPSPRHRSLYCASESVCRQECEALWSSQQKVLLPAWTLERKKQYKKTIFFPKSHIFIFWHHKKVTSKHWFSTYFIQAKKNKLIRGERYNCQRMGALYSLLNMEHVNVNIPVSDDHHLIRLDDFLQEDVCCLYVVLFADLCSDLEELLHRVGKSSINGKWITAGVNFSFISSPDSRPQEGRFLGINRWWFRWRVEYHERETWAHSHPLSISGAICNKSWRIRKVNSK